MSVLQLLKNLTNSDKKIPPGYGEILNEHGTSFNGFEEIFEYCLFLKANHELECSTKFLNHVSKLPKSDNMSKILKFLLTLHQICEVKTNPKTSDESFQEKFNLLVSDSGFGSSNSKRESETSDFEYNVQENFNQMTEDEENLTTFNLKFPKFTRMMSSVRRELDSFTSTPIEKSKSYLISEETQVDDYEERKTVPIPCKSQIQPDNPTSSSKKNNCRKFIKNYLPS